MAKVPIKLVGLARKHGPGIIKNTKIAVAAMPAVAEGAQRLKELVDEKKQMNMHPRQKLLKTYQLDLLPELDNKNRSDLINARLQVKQNIIQIEQVQLEQVRLKKVLHSHSKEKAKWEAILVRINNRIAIKDYEEYLKIYNKPDYVSNYFEGFNTQLEKYKKLINEEGEQEIITFLYEQTHINIDDIKRDFLFV